MVLASENRNDIFSEALIEPFQKLTRPDSSDSRFENMTLDENSINFGAHSS